MTERQIKWRQFYYAAALLSTAPLIFAFSGCSTAQSQPPPPMEADSIEITEGVAGGTFTRTVEVSAKVTAIDRDSRRATLLGSDGEEFTVEVGPEAVNFDQIQVGDVVKVELTEELVVSLLPASAAQPDGSTGIVALAQEGSQPGGVMAKTVQVTATVEAIDIANRKVTLSFKDGSSETFPVRDDIDLSQHKVGERVTFQTTEMVAISIEKP